MRLDIATDGSLWSARNHDWKHTVKGGAEFQAYLEKREALFRDPSLEGATALMKEADDSVNAGEFTRPDVPLAALHKARLQWLGATDAMIEESLRWLSEHGYANTSRNAPPLTPEERDRRRAELNWPPLKGAPGAEREAV